MKVADKQKKKKETNNQSTCTNKKLQNKNLEYNKDYFPYIF